MIYGCCRRFIFKKNIEEDTFEDLQDTYEFGKNHDNKDIEKDAFEIGM